MMQAVARAIQRPYLHLSMQYLHWLYAIESSTNRTTTHRLRAGETLRCLIAEPESIQPARNSRGVHNDEPGVS
jgi:hypothetical protein